MYKSEKPQRNSGESRTKGQRSRPDMDRAVCVRKNRAKAGGGAGAGGRDGLEKSCGL